MKLTCIILFEMTIPNQIEKKKLALMHCEKRMKRSRSRQYLYEVGIEIFKLRAEDGAYCIVDAGATCVDDAANWQNKFCHSRVYALRQSAFYGHWQNSAG